MTDVPEASAEPRTMAQRRPPADGTHLLLTQIEKAMGLEVGGIGIEAQAEGNIGSPSGNRSRRRGQPGLQVGTTATGALKVSTLTGLGQPSPAICSVRCARMAASPVSRSSLSPVR